MSECRSFYLWLAQVLLLLGLIALLLWLSLRPKTPNYTIDDFSVLASDRQNTTISGDDGCLNNTVTFELKITNPNKDGGIYYDTMNITLFFDEMYMGSTAIDSFYQGYHKTATYKKSIYTGQFSKAVLRAASNRTVQLKVGLITRVQYRIWGRKTKHYGLDLQGQAPVGQDGKISGKKKKIKLHHTHKKWRLHFT